MQITDLYRKSEGISVLELLIALSIASAIVIGIPLIIVILLQQSQTSVSRITAIRDVDNASSFFVRDIQAQATAVEAVTLTPGTGTLTLPLSRLESGDTSVTYEIDAVNRLTRQDSAAGTEIIIANHITRVAYDPDTSKVTVTAVMDRETVTKNYQAITRIKS